MLDRGDAEAMGIASVLVVDDDDDIRDALGSILAEEGYDVRTARNGIEAMQAIDERVPDLVFLDLIMPVMDGWRVMSAMRATPRLHAVPVVVLSALSAPECERYIQKPISLTKLMAILDTVRERAN
jgi:CheY-like chemotaxis protein